MNTVGKILVILNFLFAVVVGAFLVVDFAARTNWQNEYARLKREHEVLALDRATHIDENTKLRGKLTSNDRAFETLKEKLADQEKLATIVKADLELKVAEFEQKAVDADLTLKKAITDVKRLSDAEIDLKGIVKLREKAIFDLQENVKKYRTEAIANEQLYKSVQDRNEQLLQELQDMGEKLAKTVAAQSGTGGPLAVRNPNEPNPPKTLVKGIIEKVNSVDKDLVQISLGTDQGVNNNHTLEVFRKLPEPKYLGMVRIVDAKFNTSVGRLIVPPGTTVRPQLKEGDHAWSKLGSN